MKKITKIILGIIVTLIVIFIAVQIYFSPTPDFKRNNTVDDVKLEVQVSIDERKPIIKTLKLDDYANLTDDELADIKDKVAGKIEGDIPCVHLLDDDKIYFTFKKDGEIVIPDHTPIIDLRISPSSYKQKEDELDYGDLDFVIDDNGNRLIVDNLIRDGNRFFHQMHRYQFQYEEYILEYELVRVMFSIDGEDYISLFGAFTSNAPEGTNYFNNEYLDMPIAPEV